MVSQIASLPRSLESLPARPPTPPREKKQDTDSSSKNILSNHPVDTRLNVHTPPSYSPTSANTTETSSRRSTKRVGFLAQAEYRDAPNYADKENVRRQSTPASAPSSTISTKPIKSILKQTSSPVSRNPLDPSVVGDEATGQVNIIAMLDTTIKQLAGAERQSKLDAYTMLVRGLKMSNNLPDRIALQDKMSLFMQYIQRDVTAKSQNGNIDSSVVNHALTLLCTFFHFPAIASTLSSDFGIFIIDHCIRCFGDESVPKDVVRHLMQTVAYQDFSAKVMTADRVGRLVASLHNIEEHLKGKSIIMSRILIYRRLLKQTRYHMVTHSDWLLDLFTDMLSSMKEIRASAIALGLDASFSVGKEKQLSRRVMEIFKLQVDETMYIEYYMERLMDMTKDKESSASVPQVWSVVILLLRCPVEKWEFFEPSLKIIQRCFNHGDYHTKLEANHAWNRLIYALHLNETSFSKTIGIVCQPYISQLVRKRNGKQFDELRKVVIASVCNLYYYTFKPNLGPHLVDKYWDACVRPLIQQLVGPEIDGKHTEQPTAAASENLTQATLILAGLLNSSTPRLWKEDRVAENPLVRPDELPALDPKWVRRNAARVFLVVEPILQKTFLDLANPESVSYKLWLTLVSTVAVAASKEVKVSTDTVTFMAYAFSILARIWSRGLGGPDVLPDSQQNFLDATQVYLSMMTESLGLLPFTEKHLSLYKQNSFIPVATPSHRSGKGQGLTRIPLHHLFSILSTLPPGIPDDDGLSNLIKAVLDPFTISRSSSRAKTDLARDLVDTLPMDALHPYGPWVFISDILSLSLESSQSSYLTTTSGSEPTTIGHEYREIVKHLERGVKSTPNLPWEHWHSLFQLLVARVTNEAGEAGCAIAVVEPLAKNMLESFSLPHDDIVPQNVFKSGIELVATAKQPRDRQALDAARRRVWGTSIAGSRSVSFDPFDSFYRLASYLLETSYKHAEQHDQDEIVVPLLIEVAGFLARCTRSLVFKSLVQLQHGLSFWIQDANAQYGTKQSSNVSNAVKALWDRICSLLPDADSLEKMQLDAIEELLCSAFQSKHKHIVNTVSSMWNRAFDQVDEIQYPEKLKAVLISVHPYVDIVLPGLDLSCHESSGREPSFIESQDDPEVINLSLDKAGDYRSPSVEKPSSRQSATPGSVRLTLSTKRQLDTTPTISRRRSTRQSVTPRPRHDDSQIQFAPIQSSSPIGAMESQLLTDRQKEIRERQRENAAMFSEVRASTGKQNSPHPTRRRPDDLKDEQRVRASTPQPKHDLEDYVSSTPTPRRGQAHIVDDDHEMTDDISSSPPDPRRNLLAEMRPRSRSGSVFQEFPILSSPVSGSPAPKRQGTAASETRAEQDDAEITQDNDMEAVRHDEPVEVVDPEPEHIFASVEDNKPDETNTSEKPAAPQHNRASGPAPRSSPRSDPEVFVDALMSPVHRTPRVLRSKNKSKGAQEVPSTLPPSQPHDRSFELSDGEERSLARLVIELDSRKCEPVSRYDTESPEKQRQANGPALECITVNTGSKRLRNRSKTDESDRSSPVDPSSPAEVEGSQTSSKKSKRKRKRRAEKQEPGSGHKKRKHRKDVAIEVVPDTQVPQDATEDAVEIDTALEEMELDTDMSFISSQAPTEQEHSTAEPEPAQENSSPVKVDDSLSDRESDTEAVNLQIITEASQQSEVGPNPPELQGDTSLVDTDIKMTNQEEEGENVEKVAEVVTEQLRPVEPEPMAEKSAAERIMEALRGGLDGLRTAALTRDEVNKIEDMFFDIKRELYQAESRGR
ncbi:hypothetical protein GGS26DRAFT_573892 [Hypomontagnella submonticulosa]|nr:hypothetical protein GGS26DRAFT_573892 [Hypomontagnella submonticulosa]